MELVILVRPIATPQRGRSLRWLTTVLVEYKSTILNSFEKDSKLFFPSLFNACLSLLPFYVKFEQLRTFARKFSNIDFFLEILPLKDDELVMSEM